ATVRAAGDQQAKQRLKALQNPVGAAAGCDLLTLIVKKQDQKIAACGSSYSGYIFFHVRAPQSF
ncbi:hypothetical protein, partial [Pseudomonas sp. HMWF021]|uniref:hypothetical protein n=1 Tax=Pseudomonas sp. HMWF021 TaxID=2056857 RepID=UPI00130490DF